MGTFIEQVFNDISLERQPKLWMSKVDSAKHLEQRLQLLNSHEETRFEPHFAPSSPAMKLAGKNGKLSGALLEKAKLAFAQGEEEYALRLLNQSLQFATAEVSGHVYLHRSSVWINRGEWNEVLKDSDRALAAIDAVGEGDEIVKEAYKLHERKGDALTALEKYDEAVKQFDLAKSCFVTSQPKRKLKQYEKTISDKVNRCLRSQKKKNVDSGGSTNGHTNGTNGETAGRAETAETHERWQLTKVHPNFTSFSDKVEVVYAEGRGRYCRAKEDISAGELVFKETPFVSMLDKAFKDSYCWHCFKALKACIACPNCSSVLFCDEKCELMIETFAWIGYLQIFDFRCQSRGVPQIRMQTRGTVLQSKHRR